MRTKTKTLEDKKLNFHFLVFYLAAVEVIIEIFDDVCRGNRLKTYDPFM